MDFLGLIFSLPRLFLESLKMGREGAVCAVGAIMALLTLPILVGIILWNKKLIFCSLIIQALLASVIFSLYDWWFVTVIIVAVIASIILNSLVE